MKKSILLVGGLATMGLLPASGAVAQTGTPWLHVRVEEPKKESRVHVNLPLSVIEAVLKASPEIIERHGKIHLGHDHGLKLADIRKIWKELSATGDAELVSVEEKDKHVKVARKGDLVQVFVDKGGKEEVRVEVPVSLVDALLSGEGESANIQAAVGELQKRRGDIVSVREEDSTVRVWIDDQNAQK